ncbi:PcfJ domain-containing protein [Lamprobacter modestohalophilus]|uniref:PcfJ domain-containing protein n=1 Tax=Lamprobacter modestohalophilus TaxID=1064514 RepID=UPI0019042BC3
MLALRAALQAWLAERRHERSGAAWRGTRLHYAWDAGTNILLVDYSPLLGIDCLHTVSDWASGFATLRYAEGLFETACIRDLWLPFQRGHEDAAFRHWFATLPEDLAQALERLPARRYALAALAQRSQAVRDLILSNVRLCFLLHHWAETQGWSEHQLVEIAGRKQTEILSALGLPPYRRVLRLIAKLRIGEFDAYEVDRLLRVLREEATCNALVHERQLSCRVVKILEDYPWVAGRPLQRLLCEASNRTLREWINDSLRMGGEAALLELRRCDRPSQVRRLHERLIVEQIEQDGNRRRRFDASGHILAFPPAPFADTASIQAITTPDALQLETQLMRHCVASYTDRVYDGQYAVYKVLEPERLTLGLSLRYGGVALDQLKGVSNRRPSPEAQAAVEHWLHEQLKVARS